MNARRLLQTLLSLAVVAGCSTGKDVAYSLGQDPAKQERSRAEQSHAQHVREAIQPSPKLDAALKPLAMPFPDYPPALRREGVVGDVIVSFTVAADGLVTNPRVLGSPPPELAALALDAVQRWKFEPPRRGGAPTDVRLSQKFVFRLE